MATYDIEGYRRKLHGIIKSLNKIKKKEPAHYAKLLQIMAKRDAPRQVPDPRFPIAPGKSPGDTINNIRARQRRSGQWTVESWVPGDFKQNLWADGANGYERVPMRWNGFRPTSYGEGPARWTARKGRGFFSNNVRKIRKSFPRAVAKATNKALRATL